MRRWYIEVRVEDAWVYGRPSKGPAYNYLTREAAETAARLWGDAYDMGLVRVVNRDPREVKE